ncbi:unnamed protein product, partial [Didymodactylos carnosus]
IEQDLFYGILPQCTLANVRESNKELIDSLLKRASNENPLLVKLVKRGIAYHHGGVNNKGCVAVEVLFRNRYIQIVFSTSTLGNIVFLDIPLSKIRHLTISSIPNIRAHFPTSVTFLIRLLHLYTKSNDKNDAYNRALIALECALISSTSKQILVDIQTRYHCLHTLDFLYRLDLINSNGELVGLAGPLIHLHYFEPSNITCDLFSNHSSERAQKIEQIVIFVVSKNFQENA